MCSITGTAELRCNRTANTCVYVIAIAVLAALVQIMECTSRTLEFASPKRKRLHYPNTPNTWQVQATTKQTSKGVAEGQAQRLLHKPLSFMHAGLQLAALPPVICCGSLLHTLCQLRVCRMVHQQPYTAAA